jgi:hypothetical protein
MLEHRQRTSFQLELMDYFSNRESGSPARGGTGSNSSFRRCRMGYHRTKPFCHANNRSRRRKSNVIKPEKMSAIISSAAYMLA